MNREEYLSLCNARTSKELSAEQILDYFLGNNGGIENWSSAEIIKNGVHGKKPDRAKAIAMLRQAFDDEKTLEINFTEGEGVVGAGQIPAFYFTMKFKK